MATPIGHALAGYAVYVGGSSSQSRTSILFWFCLLMAIAPDFDFIPGILQGQPNLYHQGVSHSLGAGLFVSFAAALIIGKREFWKSWTVLFLAYASHLALDFFAPDGRPPYGQPLLWPLHSQYYHAPAPLQILWGVRHAGLTSAHTSDWLRSIMHWQNIGAIAIEAVVILPFVVLARYFRARKN